MSQNPNNNPYGSNPNYPSQPNYPPIPDTGYGGQPPSGPNPGYGGQPPSGPNPSYGQYTPPPPPPDQTPNSSYGSPYAPPPPPAIPTSDPYGPYDQTMLSQGRSGSYPTYPTPGGPTYNTPSSIPPLQPAQPPRRNNALTILISVIALLIVVGGVLGLVFYNNHKAAVDHANSTATAQAQVQATGTAQANAQATATYVKTHYPFSTNLVLNDPMKDSSLVAKYGWDTGDQCKFNNGAYEVTAPTNYIQLCSGENTNFSNFTFEVQMAVKTGGANAEGGVIFRADANSGKIYILFLGTDGYYELDTRANSSGASTIKLRSGQVSNFATGNFQVHTIGVVANGSQLSVYIDQNQVAQTTSTTYTIGQIGFISSYDAQSTTVAYTNAKVWQL